MIITTLILKELHLGRSCLVNVHYSQMFACKSITFEQMLIKRTWPCDDENVTFEMVFSVCFVV